MESTKKNLLEFKKTKLVQRLVFLWIILASALTLFFALGFMTGLSEFYNGSLSSTPLPGLKDMWDKAQKFNDSIFEFALILLVLCGICFVFLSQKRRIWYISNFVTSGLYAAFSLFLSIFLIVGLLTVKTAYNNLDWGAWNNYNERYGYKVSYAMFNFGLVVAVLLILTSAVVILTMILKMKQKKAIVQEYKELSIQIENQAISNNQQVV